jgi:signal peptidase II
LLAVGLLIVIFLVKQLLIETKKLSQIAFVLIIGGALGNIVDRAGDGAVTDFLHFYINNFSFFIFNPADAFITIGALLLIGSEFRKTSNG